MPSSLKLLPPRTVVRAALALRAAPLLPWVHILFQMFELLLVMSMPDATPVAVGFNSSHVYSCFSFMFSRSRHPVIAFVAQSLGLLRFKRYMHLVCTPDVKLLRCYLNLHGSFCHPVLPTCYFMHLVLLFF